jgi:hypothetical protein
MMITKAYYTDPVMNKTRRKDLMTSVLGVKDTRVHSDSIFFILVTLRKQITLTTDTTSILLLI